MDDNKTCELCEHCLYIGDGDFWCNERNEIIASEWELDCSETCERYKEES